MCVRLSVSKGLTNLVLLYNKAYVLDHTVEDLAQKDTELTAGLGVAIGLMAIELVSNINNKTGPLL